MADSLPPARRSEQATRPFRYELGSAVAGRSGAVVGGAEVGDGVCVGGTPGEGVGDVIDIGVAVVSLPPQADTAKLSTSTVRNTVADGLLIGAGFYPNCILFLSKA